MNRLSGYTKGPMEASIGQSPIRLPLQEVDEKTIIVCQPTLV
jgi:hypothetical protein